MKWDIYVTYILMAAQSKIEEMAFVLPRNGNYYLVVMQPIECVGDVMIISAKNGFNELCSNSGGGSCIHFMLH